jgi:D-alanine-D-alanine ligase
MGGISREREVSIESGRCVAEALKQAGVNVVVADVKPEKLSILEDDSIDVFFIALHGTFGEDGQLQEVLESKGLVYTGSPSQASRLAFDKWESKKYFKAAGVPTPEAILFEPKLKDLDSRFRGNDNASPYRRRLNKIDTFFCGNDKVGQKYVVKPLREGSTFGVSIVDDPKSVVETAEKCSKEFGDCMIERFISGKEVTVGILGKEALPVLEIRPRSGFYDYQAKYLDDRTEYLFDTIDSPALVAEVQKSAIDCFNAIGCRGVARVDFIIGDDGKPYVLEVNTIPGMTSHSLLPKAAAKAGIPMSRLCLKIVEMALAEAAIHKPAVRRQ